MKKVLIVNEFSGLATGYSIYGKEVISRLYKTGKYHIAEFSSYIAPDDLRIGDFPWKIYANMPMSNDKEGHEIYKEHRENQWGRARFEEVLLDFRPDIVLSWRDIYMDKFIFTTPLRKYFKHI